MKCVRHRHSLTTLWMPAWLRERTLRLFVTFGYYCEKGSSSLKVGKEIMYIYGLKNARVICRVVSFRLLFCDYSSSLFNYSLQMRLLKGSELIDQPLVGQSLRLPPLERFYHSSNMVKLCSNHIFILVVGGGDFRAMIAILMNNMTKKPALHKDNSYCVGGCFYCCY
ncbi:unnamed protein product [Lepeophtheirus salmonis]|uniref:(salmon louse) hypothetical protein n=1 Tax=Lepeophtheirus salmonis TaxID=72036 RepID=A0A7R8CJU0_LEPSM|nr:unnamed protein product [Lepeophtheirus salmonis]CAF2809148.1 unnamed protein product [Lepeophtheirus salmonis]